MLMLNLSTVSHVASRLILKCQTKKPECHVSFFSYELMLCVVGPDLENRCRLNKAIKRRMQGSEQKKKAAIKLNCEEKHAKSLQPLLTLHRFSSLAPLCFHLSCDVSPSARTAKKLLWNIWL